MDKHIAGQWWSVMHISVPHLLSEGRCWILRTKAAWSSLHTLGCTLHFHVQVHALSLSQVSKGVTASWAAEFSRHTLSWNSWVIFLKVPLAVVFTHLLSMFLVPPLGLCTGAELQQPAVICGWHKHVWGKWRGTFVWRGNKGEQSHGPYRHVET